MQAELCANGKNKTLCYVVTRGQQGDHEHSTGTLLLVYKAWDQAQMYAQFSDLTSE